MMVGDTELAVWVEGYRDDILTEDQRDELRQLIEHDDAFRAAFSVAISDATTLDVHFSKDLLVHHRSCIRDAVNLERTSRRLREVKRVTTARRSHVRRPRSARPYRRRSSRSRVFVASALIFIAVLAAIVLRVKVFIPVEMPTTSSWSGAWELAAISAVQGHATLDGHVLEPGSPPLSHGMLTVAGELGARLADGTLFQLGGNTRLELGPDMPMRLESGFLSIDVATQSSGAPFRIAGPHGDISVLGTQFVVSTNRHNTQVMLSEGEIETNVSGQRRRWLAPVQIHLDEAATQSSFTSIRPGLSLITDSAWRVVDDPTAQNGRAWSLGPQSSELWSNQTASDAALAAGRGVELLVPALAGQPYQVWIRIRCDIDPKAPQRLRHDTVALQLIDGQVVSRPAVPEGRTFAEGPQMASFSGAAQADGYIWIGGWADTGIHDQAGAVTVEFASSGLQRLRLVAYEGPVRVDEVRLVVEGAQKPH